MALFIGALSSMMSLVGKQIGVTSASAVSSTAFAANCSYCSAHGADLSMKYAGQAPDDVKALFDFLQGARPSTSCRSTTGCKAIVEPVGADDHAGHVARDTRPGPEPRSATPICRTDSQRRRHGLHHGFPESLQRPGRRRDRGLDQADHRRVPAGRRLGLGHPRHAPTTTTGTTIATSSRTDRAADR